MKKTLLILSMAFCTLSCTTDDNANSSNNSDCNCGQVIEVYYFNMLGTPFTKMKVKNNCTGEIKLLDLPGHQGQVGDIKCNY